MSTIKQIRARHRGREGVTPVAARALDDLMAAYDEREWDGGVGLVLFGSRARGEARPDSDLDVALIVDADECDRDMLGCWMADLRERVERAHGIPVTLMSFSTVEIEWPAEHANPTLPESVRRDGRVLCGAMESAPALAC